MWLIILTKFIEINHSVEKKVKKMDFFFSFRLKFLNLGQATSSFLIFTQPVTRPLLVEPNPHIALIGSPFPLQAIIWPNQWPASSISWREVSC